MADPKTISLIQAVSDRHLEEEIDRRKQPAGLTCLICNLSGFKNLIGHVYSKHGLNKEEYKEKTGYDGPMIDPAHARQMAIVSNAMWSDPIVKQNRINGIKQSYTEALIEERAVTTAHDWAKEISKKRNGMSKLRDELYSRAGFKCEDCGISESDNLKETGRRLELHHLNYDRYLPTLEDVQLLCQKCHQGFHSHHKTREQQFPKIARAVGGLLSSLKVDLTDENYIETPARVAAFLQTHFISRDEFEENIEGFRKSVFPAEYDNMVIQVPIHAFGMCPHHLLPVLYKIAIGYIPKDYTIGLSKLTKIANLCMKPPMLQETATTLLADCLKDILQTPDVAVVVGGKHMCMVVRSTKDTSTVTMSSVMSGSFMEDSATRAEFYSLSHAREGILAWS